MTEAAEVRDVVDRFQAACDVLGMAATEGNEREQGEVLAVLYQLADRLEELTLTPAERADCARIAAELEAERRRDLEAGR